VQKDEKETSLFTCISGMVCVIFFNFGMQSSLVGGQLHSTFGINQIKVHRAMN